MIAAGRIVALTGCPVYRDSELERVSGLYVLVEQVPYEPSNYCWSSGWLIAPHGDDSEDACVFVEDETLMEQADPKGYGQMLIREREMAFAAAEQQEKEELRTM